MYEFYREVLDDPETALDTVDDRLDSLEPPLDYGTRDEQRIGLIRVMLERGAPTPEVQEVFFHTVRQLPSVEDDGIIQDADGRDSRALGTPYVALEEAEGGSHR